MGRGTEVKAITNTAATVIANTYSMFEVGAAEHSYMSMCISHTGTAALSVTLVAINGGVEAPIKLTTAFIGNTASQVATGTKQFYKIEGGFMEKLRLDVSCTAVIASGGINVGLFLGRLD